MSTQKHLPTFLVIGAAKAGTTALYNYLKQHPQVFLTPLKETNYFALAGKNLDFQGPGDAAYVNQLSITNWPAYRAQFDGVRDEIASGEASPLYLYHSEAAARIHSVIPHVKIMAILRNPVERAFSAFVHLVRDQRETTRDFETALSLESERIAANWEHIWHYLAMGRYFEQLKRYYDLFPREQIKIDIYRDLRNRPREVLRDNLRFLEVDDSFEFDLKQRYNEATLPFEQRPQLGTNTWLRIIGEFRDEILRLQDLIQIDISHWLSGIPKVDGQIRVD